MSARRYVICDIEATGLDEEKEIIEIALITYQDGKVTEIYETLINPLRPISTFIQDLTSISKRELEDAPKFYEVSEAIRMRLEGATFVSHNTDFDYQLLRDNFARMGQEFKLKTFCTLRVAQHEIPGLKSYNLDALCHFFGIKVSNRHRAVGDALATLELFKELFQLRLKIYQKILYLPQHEKLFKKIPARAGLLSFKDHKGKVILHEATGNLEKSARELLEVSAENRDILIRTENVDFELTGSPLIAQFKKLLFEPYRPYWVITQEVKENGEQYFRTRPLKKTLTGLWYFRDWLDARKKLRDLEALLKADTFAYREGEISKEEILRHNQKVEAMGREAKFPSENLIILGEGRTLAERSFILIRNGRVLGYGHTEASEEELLKSPDQFITRRFFQHLGADLAAKRYLRELKNMRQKTDGWRTLAASDI